MKKNGKFKGFLKGNIGAAKESIKLFKQQPLNSLGQLIPVCMVSVSLIGFIVAIVRFIMNKDYFNQIEAIQGDFFKGISEGFTFGTVDVLISGVVATIILVLLIAEFLVIVISYCKTESKNKIIAAWVCLTVGFVLCGITGVILAARFNFINISEQTKMKMMELLTVFDGIPTTAVLNGFKIAAALGVIALIVFFGLLLLTEHKWMIKNSGIALLISFVLLPLVLLIIENFIPIVTGIIAILIIGGVVIIFGKILLSEGGTSVGKTDYTDKRSAEIKTKDSMENKKNDTKKDKYWEISRDAQLRVETTISGRKVIRAYGRGSFSNEYNDLIHYSLMEDLSLSEFQRGDVIVTVRGKRMTERDLYYK